jgi:hypothetical protein
MPPRPPSQQLNSGASIATQDVTAVANKYTQDFFFNHLVQDLSQVESKHNTATSLQFPGDLGRYYMTLGASDYKRVDLFKTQLNQTGIIKLPLPLQMIDASGVSYEQKELGSGIGGVTNQGLNALRGGSDSFLNSLGSIVGSSLQSNIQSATGIPVADINQVLTGLAPNQFLTVLLKGPQYKKHQFVWKMSPRNKQESENLRKIIAYLNEAKAPGVVASGQFFTFPKIFQLSFAPNQHMLYRFLPAVIEHMVVNYAPSGSPAFYHGSEAPDSVELSLSFLELEFWLSGRGMYEL